MTPHFTSVLAAAFAGAISAGSLGCDAVDCGFGTIESNGSCVPTDNITDDAQCGPGTKLGPAGTCIPELEVVCDPDTTQEQVDMTTGVITCVGIGTPSDCATDLPCSPPTDGKSTICGRLIDTQTNQPVQAVGATGAMCDAANPTATGPCSIKLTYVDALQFAMNPGTATPLIGSPMFVDDCGRYKAVDLPLSSFGFTGIAIDDATGTGDRHKLTGVALADAAAKPARGFAGYVTRNETDVAWTTSSAIAGDSFATRGVLAAVFRHGPMPVAGVTVRRNGSAIPNDDYYFSDASPSTRTTVAPAAAQTTTGMNGTALVINVPLPDNHDGAGSLPASCLWPTSLAAAIPGVVFVQIKVAETTGGAECP